MTNQYSDEFGMASSMAKELGLTPEESKKLNETIKEAREEYYEAVEAAKKKANEKIMSVLTIEQKEKMKQILGDLWDQDASRRKAREKAMKRSKEVMKKRGQQ
jgi:predicted secreted Zn-dependent protease